MTSSPDPVAPGLGGIVEDVAPEPAPGMAPAGKPRSLLARGL